MLLPPSLIVIGEYVWETRTEMTLIDKDANLQQTYFPCILSITSSFYQNIRQVHGSMGQLNYYSFSKMLHPNIAFSSLPGKAVVKIPNTEKNYKLTANHY